MGRCQNVDGNNIRLSAFHFYTWQCPPRCWTWHTSIWEIFFLNVFSIFVNTILVNDFHYSINISFSFPHLADDILQLKLVHSKIFYLNLVIYFLNVSTCHSLPGSIVEYCASPFHYFIAYFL